jgi:ABC-type lipoprotein release transport system permease subunit
MDHSRALKHKNLLFAALFDLIRRGLRSIVTTLCLTAIIFPLVTALAISEGLRFQAEIGTVEGADIYVSEDRYGGSGPISLTYEEGLSDIQGVSLVKPRVVGRTYFADRLVALVGLDREALVFLKPVVKGDIPKASGEVVVGEGIAKAFAIEPGIKFTLAANNRKVFKPTGTLRSSCLWSSDVMIMQLKDANEFFRMKGYSSQLLVYAASEPTPNLTLSLVDHLKGQHASGPGVQVEDRSRTHQRLRSGYAHKRGIFIVLYIIVFVLAFPAFLVTSGLGMKELSKEIGVLKAVGWRTWEVLEKVALENLLISLTAVSISILLSMAWIKGLNGMLIAQFYVAEVGLFPTMDIPSRYLPSHAFFCLLFAFGVTLVGSLISAWQKAYVPPSVLMR